MTSDDLSSVWLTLRLALTTTVLLVIIGTPIAWWLSQTTSRFRVLVSSVVALPLVLPPTVIGFYLLLLMGSDGPLGRITDFLDIERLSFTFTGLVIGSVVYSLPFVIHPIQNSFESMGSRPLEVAATLRAGKLDRFFTIALPQAKSGLFTAIVLGFSHTIGEFGIVLMIGGNIPGKTKVISIAIYDHVESLEYYKAHVLAGGMLLFSFLVLFFMYRKRVLTRVNQ